MDKSVGVFCPTLNVCGGGEYVAIAIANTLAENNHKVILFANEKVSQKNIRRFFGESLHPKIQIITQPTHFQSRGSADFYETIIHNYIAKQKCDVLIDAFSNCVFPWTQVSYIHFPHLNEHNFAKTFPYLSPRLSQAGTIPQVIFEKNLVDYRKRLIIANSHYTAETIRKYSGKPVEILYPPFNPCISTIGRSEIKNPQEQLVVTISRLEPNKLLERIPQIAVQTDPKISFAIIGRLCNRETLSNLESLIKKLALAHRVRVYPNASVTQKIELLKRAKIYLHTMVGEHFGISIVEAIALGCIPIVHNSGGMKEFVPSNYRYDSLPQAAALINEEIDNWSIERTWRIKKIAEQFSYPNFSSRFMELYAKYYD